MLAVPADRLPAAIGDLDPGNRALLDLSLRRGVSDAEIGELLRKEPDEVARGRDAVLELLADALEVDGHDRRDRVRQALAAMPDDAWRAKPAPARPSPPPPPPRRAAAEPRERPLPARDRDRAAAARDLDDKLLFEPEETRSSKTAWLWVLGLLTVAAAVGALLLAGSDEDEPSSADGNGGQPAQNGDPAPQPAGDTAELTTLGDGRGTGTLTITDEGAIVTLRGLPDPDGAYEVWLYDSIVKAQSLGALEGGSGRIQVRLPADARSYRFLDVSLEAADANPNHSGDSVMRTPLRELLSG